MGDKKIHHVDATLKMMTAMTGDKRFCDTIGLLPKKGGQTMDITMNYVLDQIETKGREDAFVIVYKYCRKRGMSIEDSQSLVGINDNLTAIAEREFQKENR